MLTEAQLDLATFHFRRRVRALNDQNRYTSQTKPSMSPRTKDDDGPDSRYKKIRPDAVCAVRPLD